MTPRRRLRLVAVLTASSYVIVALACLFTPTGSTAQTLLFAVAIAFMLQSWDLCGWGPRRKDLS